MPSDRAGGYDRRMSRADVLGALLEGSVAEGQVRLSRQASSEAAAEQRKLKSGPSVASFASSKHPRGAKGTHQGGKFVKAGSTGTPVKRVQAKLGVKQTGSFAFDTQAAVRAFQRKHGLVVDGIVGAQTAQALLGNRNAKAVKPGALSAADAKALGVSSRSTRPRGSKRAVAKPKPKPKPAAPTRYGGGIVA